MTDTTALDELIEAVEAGRLSEVPFELSQMRRELWEPIVKANSGSLDAAKALHDALLPGCSQYSIVSDPTCLCVKVAWWPNGLSVQVCYQGEGWDEADPARAWILAILRAYRAQIGGAA